MIEFNDTDNRVQQTAIVNHFIQAVQGREKILCPVEEAVQSLNIINGPICPPGTIKWLVLLWLWHCTERNGKRLL